LPSAEFDMIFKTPEFKEFNNSAKLKKLFVERVANLFRDKDTTNIVVLGISSVNGMTMVTWYNKTLEMNRCDEEKVLQLRQVSYFYYTIVWSKSCKLSILSDC